MPVSKTLTTQTSARHLAQACQAHTPIELTVPIDNHRQLHASQLEQLSEQHLIVSTPDDLRHCRDLMWSLPVEGMFRLAVGWGYFRTTIDADPMAVDPDRLALKVPSRLKLLLNPACLADSIVLDSPVDATFHTRYELTGTARNIPMRLEHLSSDAAACVLSRGMTCHVEQFGVLRFFLPDEEQLTKFLLRGTIEEMTEVGDGQTLVLVRFERASRRQTHRDSMERIRCVVDRWWATTGRPESPRETKAAKAITITDARAIQRELASPFSQHDVAVARAADQTMPVRLLKVNHRLLAIQLPAAHLGQAATEPGQIVHIDMSAPQSITTLEATIASHQPIELEGTGRLQAVILNAPTQCTMERRRSRFRTAVALCPPVHAMIQPEQAAPPTPRSHQQQLANATLLDISVDGAKFESIYDGHTVWDLTQAMIGQTLTTAVYIYGERDPVLLTVTVRNQSRNPSTGAVVIGVEFCDMGQSIEGRTARRQIERFTAQTQRQQIHRNRTFTELPAMAANA